RACNCSRSRAGISRSRHQSGYWAWTLFIMVSHYGRGRGIIQAWINTTLAAIPSSPRLPGYFVAAFPPRETGCLDLGAADGMLPPLEDRMAGSELVWQVEADGYTFRWDILQDVAEVRRGTEPPLWHGSFLPLFEIGQAGMRRAVVPVVDPA